MNLIVGATGLLGGEICRLLAAEGKPVRALVRPTSDQSKVTQLESLNIEVVRGDLKDRASLDAACEGTSAVISTASATLSRQQGDSIQTVDLEGQLNLIDAAKAANSSQFVLSPSMKSGGIGISVGIVAAFLIVRRRAPVNEQKNR